ncbi:uncharacterized protein C8R40DRAFT_1072576 [Lentinula edodes]|uniref:uncharacterized protein n=1 Tax=Lentinula edodes TaxID=5353 RepID=UPI001E8E68F1|nr:uncharacterized protein C8R40DRAFT_1072576 [Lentinula edodes]KAH7871268.1 hypothetical protein C8R40DRAFT_1072576 [Lentinula edodes]
MALFISATSIETALKIARLLERNKGITKQMNLHKAMIKSVKSALCTPVLLIRHDGQLYEASLKSHLKTFNLEFLPELKLFDRLFLLDFSSKQKLYDVIFLLSFVRMRTNTPAVAMRSRSSTPDHSLTTQVFGRRSPPPPSRTYGRKYKTRSQPTTPLSRRSAPTPSTPSRRRPPASSSSASSRLSFRSMAPEYERPMLIPDTPSNSSGFQDATSSSTPLRLDFRDMALDYVEPILLPATPSQEYNPSSLPLGISDTSTQEVEFLHLDSDSDEEPVLLSMKLPVSSELQDAQVQVKDEVPAHVHLDNALENAMTRIKAFEDTAEKRNECPTCMEVMLEPFMDCLHKLSDLYLRARYNFACPSCRTIQGSFTPIPNYSSQQSVDDMLESKGLNAPTRQPLNWPRAFRSGPLSLPFPRRTGIYPILPSVTVPAPFPISIDDDV